jgi:hypothetical protein|mmetsp:Transcript_6853/g.12981  ORF Transcript_6853/g.12981 Transcript_6853/m.12981 type:complete len:247 (-) Transcript_6853:4221-4961(-)
MRVHHAWRTTTSGRTRCTWTMQSTQPKPPAESSGRQSLVGWTAKTAEDSNLQALESKYQRTKSGDRHVIGSEKWTDCNQNRGGFTDANQLHLGSREANTLLPFNSRSRGGSLNSQKKFDIIMQLNTLRKLAVEPQSFVLTDAKTYSISKPPHENSRSLKPQHRKPYCSRSHLLCRKMKNKRHTHTCTHTHNPPRIRKNGDPLQRHFSGSGRNGQTHTHQVSIHQPAPCAPRASCTYHAIGNKTFTL